MCQCLCRSSSQMSRSDFRNCHSSSQMSRSRCLRFQSSRQMCQCRIFKRKKSSRCVKVRITCSKVSCASGKSLADVPMCVSQFEPDEPSQFLKCSCANISILVRARCGKVIVWVCKVRVRWGKVCVSVRARCGQVNVWTGQSWANEFLCQCDVCRQMWKNEHQRWIKVQSRCAKVSFGSGTSQVHVKATVLKCGTELERYVRKRVCHSGYARTTYWYWELENICEISRNVWDLERTQ